MPAKLSQLVAETARVLGPLMPEKRAALIARNLREAGLISSSGRGPGGADMTALDMSHFLIAIGGSNLVKEAAETVADYGGLLCDSGEATVNRPDPEKPGWLLPDISYDWTGRWKFEGIVVPELADLPERHTLSASLAALLSAEGSGSLGDIEFIEVTFLGPRPFSTISLKWKAFEASASYQLPYIALNDKGEFPNLEERADDEYGRGDLEVMRTFRNATIFSLGKLLKT